MMATVLEALPAWSLIVARCAGVMALAPPAGWRLFPPWLRLGVAAALAAPLLAISPAVLPATLGPGQWLALLVSELALGLLLGLGLWLVVWGLYSAGHLADLVAGIALDEPEEGPLAQLMALLGMALFLLLNGLHWLLALLGESLRALPPGAVSGAWLLTPELWLWWPGRFFALALTAAAPLVLAGLLAAGFVGALQRLIGGQWLQPVSGAARYLAVVGALAIVAPLLAGLLLGQLDGLALDWGRLWR